MSLHPFRQLRDADLAAASRAGLALSLLDDTSQAIARAVRALESEQHAEGHWCMEFEADCTIPSEYVLMMHFMDEIEVALERKIKNK